LFRKRCKHNSGSSTTSTHRCIEGLAPRSLPDRVGVIGGYRGYHRSPTPSSPYSYPLCYGYAGGKNVPYCSFYVAAVVKPSCVFFSPSMPCFLGAGSPGPDHSGGFLWRWDLASPTTFSPCGCTHPSPDALGVFRRQPEGLEEATPSLRRLLCKARKKNGPPPPAPRPKPDSTPTYRSRRFEFCTLRYYPGLEAAPKRHESLTGYRDNPETPQALASATKALAKPTTPGTLRLIPPPTPRPLRGHPAHVAVPRLGDALFPGPLAAVRRCWREARSTSSLSPRLQRAPAKTCHH
jgi:hypothetical protein